MSTVGDDFFVRQWCPYCYGRHMHNRAWVGRIVPVPCDASKRYLIRKPKAETWEAGWEYVEDFYDLSFDYFDAE